jgi:putative membrane protein
MSQAKFDQSACQALSECIKEIEKTTDAELVVVVKARSDHYRQADYLFGALLALAGLLFLVFSPFNFNAYWFVVDVIALFAVGAYLSSRVQAIRRRLTRAKFRAEAVRKFAAATFYDAGIANTNAEMGVLVYLSLLERRLELIADRGVLKAVDPLEWNQRLFELHEVGKNPDPESLQTAIKHLGTLLQEHLPATGENPNELPDMPRFELK